MVMVAIKKNAYNLIKILTHSILIIESLMKSINLMNLDENVLDEPKIAYRMQKKRRQTQREIE